MSIVQEAATLAMFNKHQITISGQAACYCCLAIFSAKDIKEYTDQGRTALCPKCCTDTVLGDSALKIDENVLKEIKEYWLS